MQPKPLKALPTQLLKLLKALPKQLLKLPKVLLKPLPKLLKALLKKQPTKFGYSFLLNWGVACGLRPFSLS